MLNAFNRLPKHLLIKLVLMLLSALLISEILRLFLPQAGRSYQNHDPFIARHYYRFSDAFFNMKQSSNLPHSAQREKSYTPLTEWSLKALYHEGKRGFIVALIQGKKHFISLGESLNGYRLVNIHKKEAILQRNGVEYALSLKVQSPQSIQNSAQSIEKANIQELKQGIVRRTDINNYMADPRSIWENISITLGREHGKIVGFYVKYVKPQSVFDHLGLKSGDIIVEANGVEMKSIRAAQNLYKHIDEIDQLSLKVKRNQEIKELHYEIR